MAKPSNIYSPVKDFEDQYVQPRAGLTLIVGSKLAEGRQDRRARYPMGYGLDMQPGEGVDFVHDLEEPFEQITGFSHVECMSVLEHCRKPWVVAKHIEDVMVPGATLFLTVPFVWRFHSYPSDYYRFTAEGVKELFPRIEWEKMAYATDKLRGDPFLKANKDGEHPKLPKSEVLGFGRRM